MDIIEAYDRLLGMQGEVSVLSFEASKISYGLETGLYGYQEASVMSSKFFQKLASVSQSMTKYQKDGSAKLTENQGKFTMDLMEQLQYSADHLKDVLSKRGFQL